MVLYPVQFTGPGDGFAATGLDPLAELFMIRLIPVGGNYIGTGDSQGLTDGKSDAPGTPGLEGPFVPTTEIRPLRSDILFSLF